MAATKKKTSTDPAKTTNVGSSKNPDLTPRVTARDVATGTVLRH
jgi:hypothetical protein